MSKTQETCLQLDEIPEHLRAVRGHDGFRVELQAEDRVVDVLDGHDLAVVCLRDDLQAFRNRVGFSRERVIPRHEHLFRESCEDAARCVDRRERLLAVHEFLRVADRRAIRFADALLAETHAEDRNLRPKLLHDLLADTRIRRATRPR